MKDLAKKSDREIVRLCLQNDKYFAALVDRYEDKLKRYIIHLTQCTPQESEDVLQEVFIKTYVNLNDYDEAFSFSSWIYRIAHNEAISKVRRDKVRPKIIDLRDTEFDDDFIELLPDDTDLPREMDRRELFKKICREIYNLPVKYRDVMVLRYLEDKTYQEISDILKQSMNTISVRINRARQMIRKQIKLNQ